MRLCGAVGGSMGDVITDFSVFANDFSVMEREKYQPEHIGYKFNGLCFWLGPLYPLNAPSVFQFHVSDRINRRVVAQ